MKLLLDAAADPGAAGRDGCTSLLVAARYGTAETVRLIIEAGADPDETNKNGWTALHFAARNGFPEKVRLLIKAGADVGAGDEDGWTALHHAANKGRTTSARLLIEAGAKIDAREDTGWTPLHWAAYDDGEAEMVNLLLDAGADPALPARMSKRSSRLVTAAQVARETNPKLRGTRALERLVAGAKATPQAMRMPGCEGGWKVSRGEAIGFIAGAALGDRKRYREIMALNGLSRERPHRRGECLKLP